MSSSRATRAPVWLAMAGLLACGGGEDSPVTPGPSMSAATEEPAERTVRLNAPPVIEDIRFEPAQPFAGEPVRVVARASDRDGDSVRLAYKWKLAGQSVPGGSDQVTFPRARRGDRIEVTVSASDSVTTTEMIAETRVRNRPPELTSLVLEPSGSVQVGKPIVARASGEDYDGDPITFEYEWRVNDRLSPVEGASFPTADLDRGDRVQVKVFVRDGYSRGENARVADITIDNTPPTIVSSPTDSGEDGVFRYAVRVEDADGDRGMRFRLGQAPEGMEIDLSSGEIQWSPRADQAGTHPVEVVVEDRRGGVARQSFELTTGSTTEEAPAPPAAGGR